MSEQPQRDSSPAVGEGVEGVEGVDGATAVHADTSSESAAPRGRLVVKYAGRTAVGQVREHNEDNFVIANLSTGEVRPRDQSCEDEVGERGMLFSVCDGMGGAAAGEVASQMAVEILVEALRRGVVPRNRDALARRLVQAVEEAGRRIFQAAQKERSRRGMGTTTTAAVLIDKVVFLGEVGDSRGYLLRGGELKLITKDQSLVNQLIEAGHLTEDEAEAFEHSNIILQALGTAESVNVDLTFVELRKGDRLMLCSDGLSGLVHLDTLRATLNEVRDPAECCAKLIELAEAGGGHDNITCIVVDFEGDQLADVAEGDGFGYMQYPLPLSDEDGAAFSDEETSAGGGRSIHAVAGDVSAAPTQRPAGHAVMPDATEPLPEDSRAAALWIAAGVVAMIGALGVWWTLDPQAQGAVPPPNEPAAAAPEQAAGAEAATAEVHVNVYTDVPAATLLVNGESQGALSIDQSKSLQLVPGAYRFEAQADGNPKAVSVVTVRGDTPMDVYLNLQTPLANGAGADEPGADGLQGVAAAPTHEEHASDQAPATAEERVAREPSSAKRDDGATSSDPPRPRKRVPSTESQAAPAPETAVPVPPSEPARAAPELPSNPF